MWCHCLSAVHVKLFDTFLFVSVLHLPLLGSFPHRYLLRRSALELFMVDRSNFFFDFGVHLWKISSPFPLLFACVNNKSIKVFVSNPCNMPANQPVVDIYFFLFPPLFILQSVEGRRNAYRAIVQARPPHLNNIYLATQVCILFLLLYV